MQIVIDIPEWKYKSICERVEVSKRCGVVGINPNIHEAIYSGTPLPKGHGRLIDADELLTSERPKGIADDVWNESHIYKLLSNAPTIIEADKAESEEISDRNLKMWEDIYAEEKRREGSE